jgi:DNA-binding response OmpR family regulator
VKQKRVLSVGRPESLAERSQALRAAGFSVFSTDSPEQAMMVCLQSEFDLALVGHKLSSRDKQRLVRHFREKCRIPILLVTDGPFLTTLRADAYVSVQSSIAALVKAAEEVADRKPGAPAAND